ncbi:MAG: ribonuclease P protein component [Propionivibrio sp.]|uniref:ribonuclease P protein component n=1 Tax=Propionivibrio sp. TaxID=2212460 RepID=UPI0025EFF164|nr:ribonuclease P protein component [Propionivibrio sp.]MBK8892783.1 ribonuclease P protein component [Propionivibrio sp.]
MSTHTSSGEHKVLDFSFPKFHRLTQTDEYSSVFGFRKAFRSTHFLLHYRIRSSEAMAGARLGLVVAKRLLRRSVDRNLVRRLAREHFRTLHSRLPSRDLILRLASKPEPLDRRVLADEIRGLLGKMITPER